MDNNPHIFLTRANQQIKETNRNFCGNLDSDGPMVFAKNQEKNESYTFKDMFFGFLTGLCGPIACSLLGGGV